MCRHQRDERGAIAANAALMPIVMMLFCLVLQVGLWYYGRSVATAAAHHGLEAARVVDQSPDQATANGRSTANQFLNQVGGLQDGQVSVALIDGSTGVEVTVTGRSYTIVPFMTPDVRVRLTAPVERVVD